MIVGGWLAVFLVNMMPYPPVFLGFAMAPTFAGPSPAFPSRTRAVNRLNLGPRKRTVIEAELVHFAFEIEIVRGHKLVGVVAAEPERSRDIEILQWRSVGAHLGLLGSVDINPQGLRRQALWPRVCVSLRGPLPVRTSK